MASLSLKFVNTFRDRHGKTRHYFRCPGSKSVALPGLPGSAEFMEAYALAIGESRAEITMIGSSKPGSVSAAVALYLGSVDLSVQCCNLVYAYLSHLSRSQRHAFFMDLSGLWSIHRRLLSEERKVQLERTQHELAQARDAMKWLSAWVTHGAFARRKQRLIEPI